MSQSQDEICPRYYAEDRLTLSLTTQAQLRAFTLIALAVDYSAAMPEGIALPLVMTVQGPSPQSYIRREYRRARPDVLLFTPKEGGQHLVTLSEFAHNKWWGRIVLNIEGPLLEMPRPV